MCLTFVWELTATTYSKCYWGWRVMQCLGKSSAAMRLLAVRVSAVWLYTDGKLMRREFWKWHVIARALEEQAQFSMQHSGVWQIICLFYSILLIYCCVQYFKLSRGTHFVLSFSWHCLFRHSGKFFVLSFSWHCLFRHSGKFFFSYRLCALGPMDGQGGRLGCNSSLVGHTSK